MTTPNITRIHPARVSTERLYTLGEITVLARQFVEENDASAGDTPDALKFRLFMGTFIAWANNREKEQANGKT